jgi:hypothetical protein
MLVPVVCALLSSAALAQSQPSPDLDASRPGVTITQQHEAKTRHSRFSAGPGGPLLVLTEVVSGMVIGGIVGGSYAAEGETNRGAYLGLLTGGVLLGGLASVYQYAIPVGQTTAAVATLGAAVGALAGGGIWLASGGDTLSGLYWMLGLGSQLGVILPLMAMLGHDDLSGGDAMVIGSATAYASTLTLLTMLLVYRFDGTFPGAPLMLAPAVGMAAGGLLASLVDMDSRRVVKLTAIPLGVGLALWYLGTIAQDVTLQSATALAGIGISFALTWLFTAEPLAPQAPTVSLGGNLMPTAVVLASGRDTAIGPGVFGTF